MRASVRRYGIDCNFLVRVRKRHFCSFDSRNYNSTMTTLVMKCRILFVTWFSNRLKRLRVAQIN